MKTIPVVHGLILLNPDGATSSIPLDTPAWFAWLDAPTTTRFSYAFFNRARGYIDGFMTARKERRQRGGAYWSLYRRQGRQLRKIYVGSSSALTRARLDHIAEQFRQSVED